MPRIALGIALTPILLLSPTRSAGACDGLLETFELVDLHAEQDVSEEEEIAERKLLGELLEIRSDGNGNINEVALVNTDERSTVRFQERP